MGVVDGCTADKGTEEAAEVGDADRHRADYFLRCASVGDRKWSEAGAAEDACSSEVVHGAAQRVLVRGKHFVYERAVGAGAGHDDEVAAAFSYVCLVGDVADGNGSRCVGELDAGGFDGVERQSKVASQGVGAAKRDDAERGVGLEGHAWKDFVDCAIASAGEDDVGAIVAGCGGLFACCSGSLGGYDIDVERSAEGRCYFIDDLETFVGFATGCWVEEKNGSAHVGILCRYLSACSDHGDRC